MRQYNPGYSKDREYYFAYGMNTDPRNMDKDSVPLGAAVLPNHRFRFATHADVVPDQDENVVGVLWSIDHDELAFLDQREGMPNYYTRVLQPVIHNGMLYDAWVYKMNDNYRDRMPSQGYINMLLYGYEKYGVPTGQIFSALQAFQK